MYKVGDTVELLVDYEHLEPGTRGVITQVQDYNAWWPYRVAWDEPDESPAHMTRNDLDRCYEFGWLVSEDEIALA